MKNEDLRIRITRGSGPGGQHKNKVETCVIITHLPTGLQEKCQDTRSKQKNIELAKERIEAKIKIFEENKINEAKNNRRLNLIKNQKVIRTYNYVRNEVYDHRTKAKYDLKKFMQGEIDLSLF
jgi:peptide chain release factor 1